MKIHLKIIVLVTLFFTTVNGINAQVPSNAHKDSLNSVLSKYYDLNLKIFQTNSKVDDINDLFNLFTDDFTYVHPNYGGTYTREDLYNGYVRVQKNGKKTIVDIKVENKIVGLNAVTVERRYIEKKANEITEGDAQMTFFEFKNGKIFRIFECW